MALSFSGQAILYRKNKKIPFGKGQMLVMFPGEKIFYKAQTAWTIRWVGVNGRAVDEVMSFLGITPQYPFFKAQEPEKIVEIMEQVYALQEENLAVNKYKTQSLLCKLFALMLSAVKEEVKFSDANDIIQVAKNTIAYNYNNHLEVANLAQKVFLAPAYFSRLFKEKVGISPKQYITQVRMEKAKELLRLSKYSIKNIAATVGYDDALYFSRLFFKREGITPSQFRKLKGNQRD